VVAVNQGQGQFHQRFFMHTDPKTAKKTDNLTVIWALLGSMLVKVSSRMLMKLTQGELSPISVNPFALCSDIFQRCKFLKVFIAIETEGVFVTNCDQNQIFYQKLVETFHIAE